jgi:hypothetical protein
MFGIDVVFEDHRSRDEVEHIKDVRTDRNDYGIKVAATCVSADLSFNRIMQREDWYKRMMGKVDESFSPNRMHLERNNRAEDAECTIFVAVGVEKCGGLLTFRWLAVLISVFEFSRTNNKEERGPNGGRTAGGTFCRSARRALEACEAMLLSTARSLPVFARDLHDQPYASKRLSHRKKLKTMVQNDHINLSASRIVVGDPW